MEVAYFPGCSLHSSSELYDVQCKSVLAKLDITLREIADWVVENDGSLADFLEDLAIFWSGEVVPRVS